MKAELKKMLKSRGIKTVKLDNGSSITLSKAKTSDLIKACDKLGLI